MEVKTAEQTSVSVGKKDLEGLQARRDEGFTTMLAVLGGRLTDEWLFLSIPGTDIQPNAKTEIVLLRPFADSELSHLIEGPFVAAVDRYGVQACEGGQQALNAVLQQHPNYAMA